MRRSKGGSKKGFTLIEVILFLAISGAIFAMIMTGISTSTARRRYSDSVNDIVEQIRKAYAATINVENTHVKSESSYFCSISSAYNDAGGLVKNSDNSNPTTTGVDNNPGRSRCAVYGQVITFGEQGSGYTKINRYDMIGLAEVDERNDINPNDSDDLLDSLRSVKANIVTIKQNNTALTSCTKTLAGTSDSYLPQWEARVENKDGSIFKGAIMIARSPVSGTIHTYFYTDKKDISKVNGGTLEVQNWLNSTSSGSCGSFYNSNDYFVIKAIKSGYFKNDKDLNICVGSEDLSGTAGRRRGIRVHKDGSTESSVELLSEDESVGTGGVCEK